jgi:uncharacterized protein (UPF0548 family)
MDSVVTAMTLRRSWQAENVRLADLATLPLTYTEVGASAELGAAAGTGLDLPPGYHHIHQALRIGSGRDRFERAADSVMHYGMLRGAGVRVHASTEVAEVGTLVLGRLGPIYAPCRVVYVIDEPNLRGFAYGTLRGHAEAGEERFAVRYDPASESVYAEVSAFSRPNTWWSRTGAPVASFVQRIVTKRYLQAV